MSKNPTEINKVICQADFFIKKPEDNPLDSVSCIVWNSYYSHNQNPGFFACSWDGYLRYYEIKEENYKRIDKIWEYYYGHPVLSCTLNHHMVVMVGLANGDIYITQVVNSANTLLLGHHEAPICSLVWVEEQGVLVSFGYDKKMKIWTMELINNKNLQLEYNLPEKTFTVSYSYPFIFVASSQSRVHLFNVKEIQSLYIPEKYFSLNIENLLKISCSSICSRLREIIIGGIDGRVAYIQFSAEQNQLSFKIEFTAKSQKNDEKKILGQINSVQIETYHDQPISIVSGTYQLQTNNLKKRKIFKCYQGSLSSSITCSKMDPNCQFIVYACGSDWSKGLDELYQPKVPRIFLVFLRQEDRAILIS